VLARSAFVRELPELVASLQKPPLEQPGR
jgi:hypothetical protein